MKNKLLLILLAYSAGYDGHIALTKSFGIRVSKQNQLLSYRYNF